MRSANGYAHFFACKYAGDKEAGFFLVVVSDGVSPVFVFLVAFVHALEQPGDIGLQLSLLHLFHLVEVLVEKGVEVFGGSESA